MRWLDADVTPPVVTVPNSIVAEIQSPGGLAVDFSAQVSAVDDVDGTVPVDCTPSSGSTFPLGPTLVSCTATDSSGNKSDLSTFTVSVVDTTAPVLGTLPAPDPVEATSVAGTTVSYTTPGATDNGDAAPTVTCLPGNPYPVGHPPVGCTAQDASGNTSQGTFTVTVTDKTPPTLVG